jgi:hypothetical protein
VGGAAVASIATAVPASAQKLAPSSRQAAAATHPGKLVMRPDQLSGAAARSPAARAMAEAILAIVQRDAALTHPVGYEVTLHREVGQDGEVPIGAPFYAGAAWDVWGYSVFTVPAGGEVVDTDGRFGMSILANSISCDPAVVEDVPDHGLPIVTGTQKTGDYRGHPIYDGQCVVITSSAEPPYVPVSRERFMRMHLSALHAEQERGKKTIADLDPNTRAKLAPDLAAFDRAVAEEEARFAAMSAADRAAPATIDWGAGGNWKTAQLVPPDRDGAVRLMSPNPAIFDAKLPATKAQVVTVFLPFVQRGVKPPRLEEDSLRRSHAAAIRDGLDWSALEAMVRR